MAINNLTSSEFLDSYNFIVREGEAMVSPSATFTGPSVEINTTPTGRVIGTASPATATIAPPLTRTNLRPEVTVAWNPPSEIDATAMRVAQRALEQRLRGEGLRATSSLWSIPEDELSSNSLAGAQDTFTYAVDRNDLFFQVRDNRFVSTRATENIDTRKVQLPIKISNHNDLIKFFKEKVELKLNGVKTDTTIELTLSLNLIDTGEEIISTQEVIELD
jgi:hypothetical protein